MVQHAVRQTQPKANHAVGEVQRIRPLRAESSRKDKKRVDRTLAEVARLWEETVNEGGKQ